jgi:hypothetical protein
VTAPDARQPDEKWRIGTSWGIHVYQGEKGSPGERPVATFHDPADAQRAVDAVNGERTSARATNCGRCLSSTRSPVVTATWTVTS